MNRKWPEEPWEAHGCALGMAAEGRSLEARLEMLGRRSAWSRRRLLGMALAAGALAPLALVPWQVSAQEPTGGASLQQQWEDLLLLDASRYLRLTAWQLQQLMPIARVTDARLRKLSEQQAKTEGALLAGRTVSLQEQADALRLEKTLAPNRAQAAEEIAVYVAPRFSRVLTPEQASRALLLSLGETPLNTARRPALLEPQSGFVMAHRPADDVRTELLRLALRRRYPQEVADTLAVTNNNAFTEMSRAFSPDNGHVIWESRNTPVTRDHHEKDAVDLFFRYALAHSAPEPPPGVPPALYEAAKKDRQRLAQGTVLVDEALKSATPEQVAAALNHLARRLFTSPRWKPVLEERLRQGGHVVEEGESR